MTRILCALLAALVASCAVVPDRPAPNGEPAHAQIAVTAHPLATQAALAMLDKGGTPADAAVAAQMVLGLVEPQSSGLGGGTFVMNWDAGSAKLTAYDGLASAPSQVTASLRTDIDGKLLPSESSQRGGRTVAVPGTLAVLAMVHARYGRLSWSELFEPAIRLAENGFPMPSYLHGIVVQPNAVKYLSDMQSLYFDAQGKALPVGATVRNPALAKTLRRIASGGPSAFLDGDGAQTIVDSAQRGFRPTLMSAQDLRDYRPAEREPICGPFLAFRVCTMPPSSFGGIVVLQVLQMVEARAAGHYDFDDAGFAHLYAEAGQLAQADRRKYVGDPDFVQVPTEALADPAYVRARAQLIDPDRAASRVQAGTPTGSIATLTPDASDPQTATSQIAIVDRAGNAMSITTTINLNFGSRLMADGFVLNNAMTNFSAAPKPGETIANQMAPRKRAVSSMAPTVVFDREGRPVVVGGSAGGGPIVDYIASSLIDMLANGRTPAQALARGHITTATAGKVQLEQGTSAAALAPALAAKGHQVEQVPLLSGLGFLKRTSEGWIGAADPRRDGKALGSD
ncbi:MAG: gamma-glutamyltransferase family protein [Ideonella sp.]